MNTCTIEDRIQYCADMYVRYVAAGKSRQAVKMGKELVGLIVKKELQLRQVELFKKGKDGSKK